MKINPYNFMKFSFIKDVLFFGKKERFFYNTWYKYLAFFGFVFPSVYGRFGVNLKTD